MMAIDGLDDATIHAILTNTKRIALVGASAKPERASYRVMRFLCDSGYDVTPVNPGLAGTVIQSRTVASTLAEAAPLEMVDVFRASAEAGAVVDEAIRLGARVVWMQLGVIDEAAAERGRAAGLTVVMNRCPAIESHRLGLAVPR
jgi:predicted CoA-binding protein